jgi:O-antigen/teichoic acid export membrane protein
MHGVVNVNFFKMSQIRLNQYMASIFFVLISISLLIFFIVYMIQRPLSSYLLLDKEWLYLGVIVASSKVVSILHLTIWIAEKKPKAYGIYQITQTILSTLMVIVFIIGYHYDWKGQVISLTISSIAFAIFSLSFFYKRDALYINYNKRDIKDILHFGLPMIPHQLSSWIISSGDRLLLIGMIGASATGLFSVGYQIGMVMSVVVMAFQKVWNPFIYEKLSQNIDKSIKIKIIKWTYLYFIFLIMMVFFLNQIAYYIFSYWIDPKFIDSYKYVIYILVMYALNGMYFMVVSYLFYFKKTKVLALITFSNALLHILLSYIFILFYGAIGVAYSGIISYCIMFIAVWVYSYKIYPMPWNFIRWKI